MKFELLIETGNAAVVTEDGSVYIEEVARMLREVADKVVHGYERGTVRDINGNNVGSYSLEN